MDSKPKKEGDRPKKMLKAIWVVIDGPCKGRKISQFFMLTGEQYMVEKAAKKLKKIAVLGGMSQEKPMPLREIPERISKKPMLIEVSVSPAKDGYGASNQIDDYIPIGGAQTSTEPTTARRSWKNEDL